MVATVEIPQIQAKDGDLAETEQRCTIGTNCVHYLKDQVLPPLEKKVKEHLRLICVGNLLYHITVDGTL